jgi:pimeloyl-ACP methyl ester carboxylesterase
MALPDTVARRFVDVAGLRTHYLEAGEGEPVVLLHSGEFGACAEVSWEFNIGPLSERFRVIAPDWLGFGHSAKTFSFENMRQVRIQHIARFLEVIGVPRAHFVGNSMGGGQLARAAASEPAGLPVDRMVLAGAGGTAPENDARGVLNSYDGSLEHMRRVVEVLVRNPALRDDPGYIERRHALSLIPGAWEATAAARLRMPGRAKNPPVETEYDKITNPTLIIAGAHDPLRNPRFGDELQRLIPGSTLITFADSGHSPQIDQPDDFNRAVTEFLGAD